MQTLDSQDISLQCLEEQISIQRKLCWFTMELRFHYSIWCFARQYTYTFDADISGDNVRLKCTQLTSTTIKFDRTLVTHKDLIRGIYSPFSFLLRVLSHK